MFLCQQVFLSNVTEWARGGGWFIQVCRDLVCFGEQFPDTTEVYGGKKKNPKLNPVLDSETLWLVDTVHGWFQSCLIKMVNTDVDLGQTNAV